MADKKLTNANKKAILTDWVNSATNRGDTLYYMKSEISEVEIKRQAFDGNLLIIITDYDDLMGTVTFGTILT